MSFGTGEVARLKAYLDDLGFKKALVVCGTSVSKGPLLTDVVQALGGAHAETFAGAQNQTPMSSIVEGYKALKRTGADVIVSVGGGSAIDTAKMMVLMSIAGDDYLIYCRNPDGQRRSAPALPRSGIAHIAIPTTAGSSSETLPTAGMRDEARGLKLIFRDMKLIPDLAVLDPQMLRCTGPTLTATSGVTAIARFVEALYSLNRQPLSRALSFSGLKMMWASLPRLVKSSTDIEAGSDCLFACTMSGICAGNALPSLVHGIGHIVGGRYGLQHGVAHSILLPPIMRLLLPVIKDDQFDLLEALGGQRAGLTADQAGDAAAARVADFLHQLPIPRKLSDVGVKEPDLAEIVAHVGQEFMMKNVPRPLAADDISRALRSVW
jgi:alcohol dehydrogenase class IV